MPGSAYHRNIGRQPQAMIMKAVSGAPTMLPADMKPPKAPDARPWPARGNQRAITAIATGTSPACATPISARDTTIDSKPPIPNSAVASDHSTANNGSARRAPSLSDNAAAGI